jgi:cation-dependent mannose-6-phosphate receptor
VEDDTRKRVSKEGLKGRANIPQDMFIILTSSCARFMPSRRGYSRVSLGHENGRRGRRNEDENRLIDNLDEEWDD